MNKHLKPGQTWNPIMRVYDVAEDGTETVRNCTGETVIMIIKRTQSETEDDIERLAINWLDQEEGVGFFSLDYETSKAFTGNYWHQRILYKEADMSVVRPFKL